MAHRGKTTAILLATGAVVVAVLAVVTFWGDIIWFLQSDSQRIQGKWKVVSAINDGQAMRESEPGRYLIFEGEKVLSPQPNGVKSTADYRLDEDHQPGWIDVINMQPHPTWDPTWILEESARGIYELDRYTLRVCLRLTTNKDVGDRPAAFESKPGSNNALTVFQRE